MWGTGDLVLKGNFSKKRYSGEMRELVCIRGHTLSWAIRVLF